MATSFHARRISCVLIVALAVAAWLQLAAARQSEERHAELLVRSMAHAVARQIAGSLGAVDQVLAEMAELVAAERWDDPLRREQLAQRLRSLPEIRYVALVDAEGRMHPDTVPAIGLPSTGMDVSDRDYIAGHAGDGPSRPLVGKPMVGRQTGERTFALSRPLRDADGRRSGTAVAMVASDHYAELLAANMLEAEGGTAVIRLDGLMLARAPEHVAKFGTSIAGSDLLTKFVREAPAGARQLVAKADGNHKFIGYHVLADYGLVVTSGMSSATALASWRTMATMEWVAVAVLAGLLFHWGWQTDRREAQMLEHQDELERKVSERTSLLEATSRLAEQRAARIAATHAKLTRLAQIAAHQLQEPVRPMVSFAQLARRDLKDASPEVAESLAFIEAAGLNLKTTLMAFQRYVELLGGTPKRVPLNLTRLVGRLAVEFDAALVGAGGSLTVGALPAITGDARMIEAALRELIANAIQFRHPDRPLRITVQGGEDAETWRVIVADNGCGIDDKVRPRLFEPFVRHHHGTPNVTGLGLAMCQAIAEAHGGHIVVDSTPAGTSFTLELPRA